MMWLTLEEGLRLPVVARAVKSSYQTGVPATRCLPMSWDIHLALIIHVIRAILPIREQSWTLDREPAIRHRIRHATPWSISAGYCVLLQPDQHACILIHKTCS